MVRFDLLFVLGLLTVSGFTDIFINVLTLIRWGGGRSAHRLEKPYIPLEPKVRLTSNQAVNLSLSVTVTLKKKLAFYVPRFNSDGPRKSAVSHFQIAKF